MNIGLLGEYVPRKNKDYFHKIVLYPLILFSFLLHLYGFFFNWNVAYFTSNEDYIRYQGQLIFTNKSSIFTYNAMGYDFQPFIPNNQTNLDRYLKKEQFNINIFKEEFVYWNNNILYCEFPIIFYIPSFLFNFVSIVMWFLYKKIKNINESYYSEGFCCNCCLDCGHKVFLNMFMLFTSIYMGLKIMSFFFFVGCSSQFQTELQVNNNFNLSLDQFGAFFYLNIVVTFISPFLYLLDKE